MCLKSHIDTDWIVIFSTLFYLNPWGDIWLSVSLSISGTRLNSFILVAGCWQGLCGQQGGGGPHCPRPVAGEPSCCPQLSSDVSTLQVTSLVPTQELPTVAWTEDGVQVTVSLQASLAQQGQILVRWVKSQYNACQSKQADHANKGFFMKEQYLEWQKLSQNTWIRLV